MNEIYRVDIDKEGNEYWYDFKNVILHRPNGPAITLIDGNKWWYKNGKIHREDGPAFENTNTKECSYWLNGKVYPTKEDWEKAKQPTCSGKIVEIDGKKYKLTEV